MRDWNWTLIWFALVYAMGAIGTGWLYTDIFTSRGWGEVALVGLAWPLVAVWIVVGGILSMLGAG